MVKLYEPSSLEFVFMIRRLYDDTCHPLGALRVWLHFNTVEELEIGLFDKDDDVLHNPRHLAELLEQNETTGLIMEV